MERIYFPVKRSTWFFSQILSFPILRFVCIHPWVSVFVNDVYIPSSNVGSIKYRFLILLQVTSRKIYFGDESVKSHLSLTTKGCSTIPLHNVSQLDAQRYLLSSTDLGKVPLEYIPFSFWFHINSRWPHDSPELWFCFLFYLFPRVEAHGLIIQNTVVSFLQ
jgi:hypothetical protein